MKIGNTLVVAILVLVGAQPVHSQEPSATDRQAAAAALALIEARGDLPDEWIAAPAEIVEGDGTFDSIFDSQPGTYVDPYVDPSQERPAPIGLFTCDTTRCIAAEGPIPVMVRRLESDEPGVTLLVLSPSVSPDVENAVSFGFEHFVVRVEGLGTEELVGRLVQREASTWRAPQPSDPAVSGARGPLDVS